jgi:hypothetical protein
MHSDRRLFIIAVLLVALAASFTPVVAKTPIAPSGLPAQLMPAGARAANDPATSAASSPAIEHVDSFGGIIPTFAVSGTFAFVLKGSALTVLDISAPAAPTRIGHLPLLPGGTSLTVVNGIGYISGPQTVQILDLHNPALPVQLASFQPRGYVFAMQVVGTSAYLTEGFDGVEIIDVSDASHPLHVAQYAQPGFSGRFVVGGSLAYFINVSGDLTILDISTPSAPIVRGTFALSALGLTAVESLVVVGNRAYINAFTNTSAGSQSRLVTLDSTHPESPLLLGNIEFPASLVAVDGNIAYIQSNAQLQLFDLTNPAQPVAHGMYPGTPSQAVDVIVQVAGNRVYLVQGPGVFKIIDASNLDNLAVLGSYAALAGLNFPERIQVAGSTGYVLNQGLQILDLTDPISPTLRGFYPSELAIFAQVVGSHAYIDNGSSGLDLLDISNPDLPARIATLALNSAQAVAEANSRAYILTAERETCGKFCINIHHMLNVFDISKPSIPLSEGRMLLYDTSSPDVSNIVVKGSLAYVAGGGALRVVDVSVPTPLVPVTYPLAGAGNQMEMVGNLAYVTTTAGLAILDLTDPLKPSVLGQTGSLGYPDAIQVQGSLAFVGGTAGVRVVDISNPSRPIPRAAEGDWIGRIVVLGDIIYVAGGTAGLAVLRLHADRFPPPAFLPLARH